MAQRRPHYLVKYPRLRKAIPRNHQECLAFLQKHIFLWRSRFGNRLLGIGFYDRFSHDETYRNISLSINIIIREHLSDDRGIGYGKRLARGIYLNVSYKTEADYLEPWIMLTDAYWLINSLIVLPLYKRNYINQLVAKTSTIHHPRRNYLIRSSEAYVEVQEVLPQLLAEIIGEGERPIVAAYVNHLMHKILVTLSFLNEHPFTGKNINDFAHETRFFALKPLSYDEFADFHAQHLISDYLALRNVSKAVVAELKELIEGEMKKETEFSTTETPFRVPEIPD